VDRVYIHGAFGGEFDPFQKSVQVAASQHDMPSVMASHALGDARGRADNLHVGQALGVGFLPEHSGHDAGLALASSGVDILVHQMRQAVKGRIALLVAGLDFSLVQG
jgi:hypothetical protein